MPKTELVDLPDLSNYQGPIDQLITILTKYKKQYGAKAKVVLKCFANTKYAVQVMVERRKKEID